MSHEECVQYHKQNHAPLGARLKSYTAYYVNKAYHLTEGLSPVRPYDIIVLARFEDEFRKGTEGWQKTTEGIQMTRDEENFINRDSAVALECQVHKYIA